MWWERAKDYDLIMTWPKLENHDLSTFVISGGIMLFTGGGPSHVMIYRERRLIWEVTWPKPRVVGAEAWNTENYDIEIGFHWVAEYQRDKFLKFNAPLMDQQMRKILTLGKTYDIWELGWQLLDELGIYHLDKSDQSRFVCSSGVESVWKAGGLPFRPDQKLVSPQDIRMSKDYGIRWQSWASTSAIRGREEECQWAG